MLRSIPVSQAPLPFAPTLEIQTASGQTSSAFLSERGGRWTLNTGRIRELDAFKLIGKLGAKTVLPDELSVGDNTYIRIPFSVWTGPDATRGIDPGIITVTPIMHSEDGGVARGLCRGAVDRVLEMMEKGFHYLLGRVTSDQILSPILFSPPADASFKRDTPSWPY